MKILSDVSRSAARRQVSLTPRRPGARGAGHPAIEACLVDVVHAGAVKAARAALPGSEGVARVANLLAVLSNPTRLSILFALQPGRSPPRPELCVCDLAVVTGASKSLTSHQLRLLRVAGLVQMRRDGKLVYYRLADGPTLALLGRALRAVPGSMDRPPRKPSPGSIRKRNRSSQVDHS